MQRSLSLSLLVGATLAATSCERAPQTTAPSHGSHGSPHLGLGMTAAIEPQINALRAATASFKRFDNAVRAGWGTQITDCFSDPKLGGMGFHYGNTALIDDIVDPLQPELLLYEPQEDGSLKFVAVEYIVPLAAWTAPQPPSLYGQTFHRNDVFGLWVLHVWHVQKNKSGLFNDWNPIVSCRYATP